jgi:hypothetical protein
MGVLWVPNSKGPSKTGFRIIRLGGISFREFSLCLICSPHVCKWTIFHKISYWIKNVFCIRCMNKPIYYCNSSIDVYNYVVADIWELIKYLGWKWQRGKKKVIFIFYCYRYKWNAHAWLIIPFDFVKKKKKTDCPRQRSDCNNIRPSRYYSIYQVCNDTRVFYLFFGYFDGNIIILFPSIFWFHASRNV